MDRPDLAGLPLTKKTDLRPRCIAYLTCGVILVALAPQTSDIATIWMRQASGDSAFEYPVLARLLYLAERAVAPSRLGIALVNAAVQIVAAVCIIGLLRRNGGRHSLWMAAPSLMLVTLNVEGITALLIVLAEVAWRRGRSAAAGMWAGIGTAFKLVPVLILPPLLAVASRREAARIAAMAAVAWAVTNIPYALWDPAGFRFPYQFAIRRHDGQGTIWAAVGLSSGAVAAVASLAAFAVICLAIATATRYRRIDPESGCALALLGLLGTSKLWQPHYLLWALAALSLTNVPALPVRLLEVANLVFFIILWRQLPPESEVLWLWPIGAARIVCLVWVAAAVVRSSKPDAEPVRAKVRTA
jgi:uncharacterized membrane protein